MAHEPQICGQSATSTSASVLQCNFLSDPGPPRAGTSVIECRIAKSSSLRSSGHSIEYTWKLLMARLRSCLFCSVKRKNNVLIEIHRLLSLLLFRPQPAQRGHPKTRSVCDKEWRAKGMKRWRCSGENNKSPANFAHNFRHHVLAANGRWSSSTHPIQSDPR